MSLTITLLDADDEGETIEVRFPARYEVCHRCHGTGTHVNPAIDGHGITAEEMDELGDDFRDDYMAGVYNVPCHECDGVRVVPVLAEDLMEPEELAHYYRLMQEAWESHAADRSEAAYFGYDR